MRSFLELKYILIKFLNYYSRNLPHSLPKPDKAGFICLREVQKISQEASALSMALRARFLTF